MSEEEKHRKVGEFNLYYVRDGHITRFNNGERGGPGISILGATTYGSFKCAMDGLVEFATSHSGYDWARMDDDWTPEDGSLDRMLAARKKDFKRYKFRLADKVREERHFRYRGGCGCIGEKVRDEHPICWEGWRVSLGNPE